MALRNTSPTVNCKNFASLFQQPHHIHQLGINTMLELTLEGSPLWDNPLYNHYILSSLKDGLMCTSYISLEGKGGDSKFFTKSAKFLSASGPEEVRN